MLKTKTKKELDVDFIGGMAPLTKDEEKKISEFLRARKLEERRTSEKGSKKKKVSKRERIS